MLEPIGCVMMGSACGPSTPTQGRGLWSFQRRRGHPSALATQAFTGAEHPAQFADPLRDGHDEPPVARWAAPVTVALSGRRTIDKKRPLAAEERKLIT